MSPFYPPSAFIRFLGPDGEILPFGKLYFYLTGTLTEAPVYDADGDVLAQPVLADITGAWQQIYLSDDTIYRVRLLTALDVEVGDVDPWSAQDASDIIFLQAGTGAVARTVQSRLRDTISVKDFGAVGDGVNNDTAEIQAALTYAGTLGKTVFFPAGNYLCTADLLVPVEISGTSQAVDIEGDGWRKTIITFSGAGVTHGLYFNGVSGYLNAGAVRNIAIIAAASAPRGMTFSHVQMPTVDKVYVHSFLGAGAYFDNTLMAKVSHSLFQSNGSSTEGNITVDNSTTFMWDHSYISGGASGCIAGLMIDRTPNVTVVGGAIESCGIPILVASKTEGTIPCDGGFIAGIDLENPTGTYIKIGSGWTGSAGQAVLNWDVHFNGSISGAAAIPKGVTLYNCTGMTFNALFGQPGTPTCSYSLEGTGNAGIYIRANRSMFGNAWPYVKVNGTMRNDATPYDDFNSDSPRAVQKSKNQTNVGATLDCMLLAAQGGICGTIYLTNASPQDISGMTGGEGLVEVSIIPQDGNSTFKQNTATPGFRNRSGSDVTGTANLPYTYKFDTNTGDWAAEN